MDANAPNASPVSNGQQTTQETTGDPTSDQQASHDATADETMIVEIGPDGQQMLPHQPGGLHGGQQSGWIDTGLPSAGVIVSQITTTDPEPPSDAKGTVAGETDAPPAGERGILHPIGLLSSPNQGYESPRPSEAAKDVRLIKRALREGWKIPPQAAEALPRALLEVIGATYTPAPDKPAPKGPAKYLFKSETRMQAIKLMTEMEKQNMVADETAATTGPFGSEPDIQTQTRRAEQLRRQRCIVIDDAAIDRIIEAHSQAVETSGAANGDSTVQ